MTEAHIADKRKAEEQGKAYILNDVKEIKAKFSKTEEADGKNQPTRLRPVTTSASVLTDFPEIIPKEGALKISTELILQEAELYEILARTRRFEYVRRVSLDKMRILDDALSYIETHRPVEHKTASQDAWDYN